MFNKIAVYGFIVAMSSLLNLQADNVQRKSVNAMQKFAEMNLSNEQFAISKAKAWSTYSVNVKETGQVIKVKFPHKPEKSVDDGMTFYSAAEGDVVYALAYDSLDLDGKTLQEYAQEEFDNMDSDEDVVLIDSEMYEEDDNIIINAFMHDTYLGVYIHTHSVITPDMIFILMTGHESKNKKQKHDYFIDSFQIN